MLPASGAWRPGDRPGHRQFVDIATDRPFVLGRQSRRTTRELRLLDRGVNVPVVDLLSWDTKRNVLAQGAVQQVYVLRDQADRRLPRPKAVLDRHSVRSDGSRVAPAQDPGTEGA